MLIKSYLLGSFERINKNENKGCLTYQKQYVNYKKKNQQKNEERPKKKFKSSGWVNRMEKSMVTARRTHNIST